MQRDADGDLDVDGDDLLIWQRQLYIGGAVQMTATPVPEPAGGLLLLGALAGLTGLTGHTRRYTARSRSAITQ